MPGVEAIASRRWREGGLGSCPKEARLIKIIAMLRRNPQLDPQQFRAYWEGVHAPMVRARLPGLVHYVGGFPAGAVPDAVAIDRIGCDAVVEMGFADHATMTANLTSAAFLAEDRRASSAYCVDEANSQSIVTEMVDMLSLP